MSSAILCVELVGVLGMSVGRQAPRKGDVHVAKDTS